MMLTHDALTAALSKADTQKTWDVTVFDQLPSTNDYLRSQPPVDPRSIGLCATDWQTAGHGRRGKAWTSQRGNITFTLRQRLNRPAAELMGLSLVAGIGVASVLRHRVKVPADLKWPNDVLVAGQKLGGLLIELLPVAGERNQCDVMTGIGLNVKHQHDFDGLGIGATSLEKLGHAPDMDRHELLAGVASAVASGYAQFETQGWPSFEERWRAIDALMGMPVKVSGREELTGKACGVNASGALLVDTGTDVHAVMGGEVSVRPV